MSKIDKNVQTVGVDTGLVGQPQEYPGEYPPTGARKNVALLSELEREDSNEIDWTDWEVDFDSSFDEDAHPRGEDGRFV